MTQKGLRVTERLPAELLTMIFQAWKNLCGTERHGLAAEWVRATWVCKTWREVALEAAALWSSVLVSRCLADDPALKTHLARAHGVALDLLVLCPQIIPCGELEEALGFILSKAKSIKQLQIIYTEEEQTVIKGFVRDIGVEVVSLSLECPRSTNATEVEFDITSSMFPRLHHLALNNIVPTASGTPLLTLIQLEINNAWDGQAQTLDLEEHPISTRINRLLAACPNLESLQMTDCFMFPPDYSMDGQLIVALPKLRYLLLEDLAFHTAKALETLRLPPSSSFHINTCTDWSSDCDFTSLIIPCNVSEALPPIRQTRCLSLMVGQAVPRHLVLRGGPDDAFEDEHDWSITISDLEHVMQGSSSYFKFLSCEEAKLYYLGFNGQRFLTHVPDLVVPSQLVNLQLHFAHGLPVEHNWSRFFATMPHLRTLGIGGCALVEQVLKALPADLGLCNELQNLTLCATTGPVTDELRLLQFFRKVVGSWVRKRARTEAKLSSLTVRIPTDALVSHAPDVANDDGGLPEPNADDDDERLSEPDVAPPAVFGSKLRRDLAWLEDLVGKVVVENADCPACGMEYDLPRDPDGSTDDEDTEGSDEDGDEDGDEPYFY